MIYLIARLNVEPGTRDTLIAAAKPCIAATRQEVGCIRYELAADVLDPNVLVFTEEWENRECLATHFTQPHMDVWREASAPHIVSRTIEVIYPEKVEEL